MEKILGHFSMFLILPKEKQNGLANFENRLTGELMLKMIRGTIKQKVEVKINEKNSFQLISIRNFFSPLGPHTKIQIGV